MGRPSLSSLPLFLLLLLLLLSGCRATEALADFMARVAPAPSASLAAAEPMPGDVLYRGAQSMPALVYHNWTDSVIVAFEEGRLHWADTAYQLRLVRLMASAPGTVDVDISFSCPHRSDGYRRPRLAMAADGLHVLLAAPTRNGHVDLYCSPNAGREWAPCYGGGPAATMDVTGYGLVDVQARRDVLNGFYLLFGQSYENGALVNYRLMSSADGGETWVHASDPGDSVVGMTAPSGIADHASLLTKVVPRDALRMMLVSAKGRVYSTSTGGIHWTRQDSPSDIVVPFSPHGQTLVDSAAFPRAQLRAWAFSYENDSPIVDLDEGAHLYPALGESKAVMLEDTQVPMRARVYSDWRPSLHGAQRVVVDGRSCKPVLVDNPGTQQASDEDECQPDYKRLATSYFNVPLVHSVAMLEVRTLSRDPREGTSHILALAAPEHDSLALAIAANDNAQLAVLFYERAEEGEGAFLLHLRLAIYEAMAGSLNLISVTTLQSRADMRAVPGSWKGRATADSGALTTDGGGDFLVAFPIVVPGAPATGTSEDVAHPHVDTAERTHVYVARVRPRREP